MLRRRGHRVVFIVEESFAGTLEAQGFEERLMRLGPSPGEPEAPGQFWKDFVRDTAPVFRTTPLAQLSGFIAPTWQALVDGARYVEPRLGEILDELAPDVVVQDNVVSFPAVCAGGRPWVRIMSCNPLERRDPRLPPAFSGLASDDPAGWAEFSAEYARVVGPLQREFSAWCEQRGAPALPDLEMIHASPWLNLELYPDELSYPALAVGRPPLAHPADQRARDRRRVDPAARPGRAPPRLCQPRLTGIRRCRAHARARGRLSDTPHRYVVSTGPRHDEYGLADNMIGAEFLPQTSVLPHVDAVITHGGNNTVTESLWFGLPMIVLPIFWDQHDNAQRVAECGHGVRLPTYGLAGSALPDAVDRVLGDPALRARCVTAGRRLRVLPGTEYAADLIARVAATGRPIAD